MFVNYISVLAKDVDFPSSSLNFLNTGVSINFVQQAEFVSCRTVGCMILCALTDL